MSLFKTFAALCLGLLALPITASAQGEDWTFCAQEGQVCRVRGESMIRYGADGGFVFRMSSDPLPCNSDTFGTDPRPQVYKHCDVSVNWRKQERYRNWQGRDSNRGDWILCANEGDVCRVPGETVVRYGGDGRYAERAVRGDVACNNGVFGDPVEGMAKQCAYKRLSDRPGERGGDQARRGLPWAPCAREGERCEFRGPTMVRYGAPGRWVYVEDNDGLRCINETFGTDPAPREPKRCDVLRFE